MPAHVRYYGGIIQYEFPYGVPMPQWQTFRDDVRDWFYARGIHPVVVLFTAPCEHLEPYVVDDEAHCYYEQHYHLWFADENLAFEFKMQFG